MSARIFDPAVLSVPPAFEPADEFRERGARGIFYEGPSYKGRPTRVFAWLGLPESTERVPGIVLVHGGGGGAFAEWVRFWTARGYAAIAMDVNGHLPRGPKGRYEIDPMGGPVGNSGSTRDGNEPDPFADPDGPVEDAWPFHAVNNVIRAHSLLRSLPQVNPDRIGITGVSWGGWLTTIAVGLDQRFKCAVPVYGCGFIHEQSKLIERRELDPVRHRTWIQRWDPGQYLPNATAPMLWVNGTNDAAYWLPNWVKSSQLPNGPCTRSLILRMEHGHVPGREQPEIAGFVDQHLRGGPALPMLQSQGEDGHEYWAKFDSPKDRPIARALLLFTRSHESSWPKRLWETIPARWDAATGRAAATVPSDATAFVLNVIGSTRHTVSAEPKIRLERAY